MFGFPPPGHPIWDDDFLDQKDKLTTRTDNNSWGVVLIDHTRSFTPYHNIRNKENLTRCSRALLARMSALTAGAIAKSVGTSLTRAEITALLARRDRIVAFFNEEAKAKGEKNVLFG